jgi:hypothetical protein
MDSTSRRTPNQLVAQLRGKGYTVPSFAARFAYNERTVKAALHGERKGKLSQEIMARVRRLLRNAA